MSVGERIRDHRTAVRLSQEELAQRALASRPTLSHWETGRTLPDAQSLMILSQIFGVSIDDLVLGDADEMRDMVRAEARASHGRTILLAGITAASACALATVGLTARDGVRDPFSALVLSLATAVALASALVWAATLIVPSLFIS